MITLVVTDTVDTPRAVEIADNCPGCGALLKGKNTLIVTIGGTVRERIDVKDVGNVLAFADQAIEQFECSACHRALARANLVEKNYLTKDSIILADMFEPLRGPVHPKEKLPGPGQWGLYSMPMYTHIPRPSVSRHLNSLGFRLVRDTQGCYLAANVDDETAEDGLDDDDAALAYVHAGGMIAKLPHSMGSVEWRLYPVVPTGKT